MLMIKLTVLPLLLTAQSEVVSVAPFVPLGGLKGLHGFFSPLLVLRTPSQSRFRAPPLK